MQHIPKISITGTKGKTTVTSVVSSVLQQLGHDVLKVDTTGHFVNGEQRSTLEESKMVWNLVPSVCPGRYLYEFKTDPVLSSSQRPVAVMEAALGCSASAGLGYREHEVGVFLNVLEDHIGSSPRLKNRADIAAAKDFVFRRVRQDGYAVFNADDEHVAGVLNKIPEERNITLIPCGRNFDCFDISNHLKAGGMAVTVKDNSVIIRKESEETVLFDLTTIAWTFEAKFEPSVYNLLLATGALIGHYKGQLPDGFKQAIEAVRLDPYGGRLTLLRTETGTTILADYAHEKFSLSLVGDLAKTLVKPGGKVIGVVRLAYDRTPELIKETGEFIAAHYDQFVVYDKIDGHFVKGEVKPGRRFQKIDGHISKLLTEAIASQNPAVVRIVREDEAIVEAARQAGPNDVVVVIVNDDIRQSIGFIQDSFKARFI